MGWLANLFGGKKKKFVSGDTRSPEFALHTLQQLHKRHAPAIIHFKNDENQYVSLILEINKEKNFLLLDAFSPETGHQKALAKEKFRFSSSDKGISVYFNATISEQYKAEGVNCYKVPLPKSIDYHQRRDSFRLKLSVMTKVPVKFLFGDQIYSNAYIKDISFAGMKIEIPDLNLEDIIKPNDILESCSFLINDDNLFVAKLEARRVKYDRNRKLSYVGGKFVHLDPIEQQMINHFVSHLEREEIQKEI